MAKQTPEEKFIAKVQAACLEQGIDTPADGSDVAAWREVHRQCMLSAGKVKAHVGATLAVDKGYRASKRQTIRANMEDRLAVTTDMAETIVLAKLQRESLETSLREKLGMVKTKPVDSGDNPDTEVPEATPETLPA